MSARGELSACLSSLVLQHLRESGRYHLPGFGVWTLRNRPARRIKDPVTREWMELPETPEVRFRACKGLKDELRKGKR